MAIDIEEPIMKIIIPWSTPGYRYPYCKFYSIPRLLILSTGFEAKTNNSEISIN